MLHLRKEPKAMQGVQMEDFEVVRSETISVEEFNRLRREFDELKEEHRKLITVLEQIERRNVTTLKSLLLAVAGLWRRRDYKVISPDFELGTGVTGSEFFNTSSVSSQHNWWTTIQNRMNEIN